MSEIVNSIKNTPISHLHANAGAKMVNFAGFNMPIVYSSVNEEHLNVRNHVGLFDVSHMGEFFLTGADAFKNVQNLTTNDVSKLVPGKAQYSALLNDNGGIIDDLLVYMIGDEEFMLVVNGANTEKDWNWISAHIIGDCELQDRSENTGLIAIQGPEAGKLVQKLTNTNLSEIPYYCFRKGNIAGIENVIISATGYTGSGGFELYCDAASTEKLWSELIDKGKEFHVMPAGLAARNTLRLEMGFCLHGNDIDEKHNTLEAGLGWITKLNTDFIGKKALLLSKEKGLEKKLAGFEMIDRGIAREGYPICDENGREIGKVTSGSFAPSLNKNIGLGYIPLEFTPHGSNIFIEVRGKLLKAEVCSIPFYKEGNK